jgi:hypothetical protein
MAEGAEAFGHFASTFESEYASAVLNSNLLRKIRLSLLDSLPPSLPFPSLRVASR